MASPLQKIGLVRTKLESSDTYIIDAKELDWTSNELLGKGTHGTVYRVLWHRQGGDVLVAVKKTNDVDPNEIEVLMQLKNEYIIGCHGVVIQEPTYMIIMEYAPHGSLDKYLDGRSGQLPLDQIRKWCMNLALAVNYLHDNDFVHRDIKAGNCLISGNMELKLCDFHDAKELKVTVSTECRGSWPWMAPEVMSSQTSDPNKQKFSKKSDIYSLAIVYWQILTCQVPFSDLQNGMQIMWKVHEYNIRPVIPQECPDVLASLLRDCWQKDRSVRPDMSRVVARLSML